jgi:hypothetical protein
VIRLVNVAMLQCRFNSSQPASRAHPASEWLTTIALRQGRKLLQGKMLGESLFALGGSEYHLPTFKNHPIDIVNATDINAPKSACKTIVWAYPMNYQQ